MIRVLLADDHTIVRKGLKQILSEGIRSIEFGEASNASEAIDLLKKDPFDIVILDLSMPGRSGLDLLKDIKVLKPKIPVFILSMYPEDQYALRVIKAGAMGYMTKDSAPEELVKGVTKILNGGKYVSPALSEHLLDLVQEPSNTESHQMLSDREFEVLRLIASGKTVSEIGTKLSLSVKTVSTYRTRILEKLHLSTNSELTRYAMQRKLVD
ncbi:MAG: response regulator transcription factor [Ignavibacteriales bacterium]|nr:response regulator transcription factor [Ignavibacteriales bacterium]